MVQTFDLNFNLLSFLEFHFFDGRFYFPMKAPVQENEFTGKKFFYSAQMTMIFFVGYFSDAGTRTVAKMIIKASSAAAIKW